MLRTVRLQTTCVAVIAAVAALTTTTKTTYAQTTYDIELVGIQFVYEGASNSLIDLTIQPGDTVRWTWVSGNHNVVSGGPGSDGSLFSSGMPTNEVGTIFEYTFNDLGVFDYLCVPHEVVGMVSTVTVVPEPSTFVGMSTLAGILVAGRRRVTR